MSTFIPQVNLNDYVNGTPEQKAAFVEKLGKAFEEVGFVTVINHGIPADLIENLYGEVKQFFSLPSETKVKAEVSGLAGQRGYTSFGKEHAKQSQVADLKEFFQYGQTVEDNDPIKSQYPDNVATEELKDLNKALYSAYRSFEKSGSYLLNAIANYLNLPENYFDGKIKNGNSILRAIHYPPITSEPKNAIRAEEHEDINLITLLVGASAEGLQVLTKQGDWLAITARPGEIVVNVGDMLQRLTNNKLRSTTHRVVNPPREMWHTSRFSVPFFLHPRSEMKLDCLEHCISDEQPLQYTPITAGEYLDERLREIGLKK
ncbi:MAG: isopenicillin N synthase family oxygenase [Sphingobacteriales bacterium]|nr:isopenicillin N synthase family oxygenase [Sphingobacteriales bacterium]